VILPALVFPGRGIQLKYACGIYQQKREKRRNEKRMKTKTNDSKNVGPSLTILEK
jgi:hypothetical protein